MQPSFVDEHTRFFELNPRTSALIIVDMQYASGSRDHGLGRLLASQGRLGEAEYRFDRIENVVIQYIQRLQQCFRDAGSCSEEMQAATLKTLTRLWGRVLSTDEVIAEMTGGPARSAAGAGL